MRGILILLVDLLLAVFPVSLVQASDKQAKQIQSVVIVTCEKCSLLQRWPEAERAVAKELQLVGISVVYASSNRLSSEAGILEELNQKARSLNASMALMISRNESPGSIAMLRLSDLLNNKLTTKKIPFTNAHLPDAAAIFALRTIDTLRAGLYELRLKDNKNKAEYEKVVPFEEKKPAINAESNADNAGKFSAEYFASGGLTMLTSLTKNGMRFGAALELSYRPWHPIGFSIDGLFASFGKPIESQGVESKLLVVATRGWLNWYIVSSKVFIPSLSFGAGALFARAKGVKGESELNEARGKSFYLGSAINLNINMTKRVFLRTSAKIGIAFSEILLVHYETKVAQYGQPLIEGHVMIGFFLNKEKK